MKEPRLKPRSLKRYSEAVQKAAREAFLRFTFVQDHYPESQFAKGVRGGALDEGPGVQLAGFIIDGMKPAGVICKGCGSSWSDERLTEERAKRPELRSCCPERDSRPVYWCADAV